MSCVFLWLRCVPHRSAQPPPIEGRAPHGSQGPCASVAQDLSVGAFEALTGGNLDPPGTFDITWHFV